MSVYDQDKPAKAQRIFISYSSIDRVRTNGLALLLEAMGHQVFHDHRTIKPGRRWKAALQDGLDDADAVMVFWTKHAAKSHWVRHEYEYFAARYGDRLLIPVVADETPLAELLQTRQQADFVPVVNEVLDMKRRMKKEGAGTAQIAEAVRGRLGEAGVELKTAHQKRLLFLFLGFGWLLTLLRYPGSWFRKAGNAAVEKTAQAGVGQIAVLALVAAAAGGMTYPAAKHAAERAAPAGVAPLLEENEFLREANQDLAEEIEELRDAGGGLRDLEAGIGELGQRIDDLAARVEPTACVTPQDFAACEAGIGETRDALGQRLDGISALLERRGREADEASSGPGADRRAADPPGSGAAAAAVFRVVAEPVPDANDCDPELEALERIEPDYPREAVSRENQGNVLVRASIDAAGNVTEAVVESGVDETLDTAARDAMLRWKFSVCTVDGEASALMHRVLFKFSLHD